ncbi:TPA: hypothetical protein DDZ86_04555 [Candidatus Dependentiae bacterium]|nr:MAG: hypothetical protein UW09_C0002G0142 [candidate division TM6 bacterium GW2011_GWF2_43_87]HBL98884.1 hypothetical protein [Candidatus Dependentiae bacterium]
MKNSIKAALLAVVSLVLRLMARLLPHAANVSPVGAIALFAGALFPQGVWAFFVVLFTLVAGDCVLGFHSTTLFVYGSFMGSVLLGRWIFSRSKSNPSVASFIGASLLGSTLFFLVSNAGVWLCSGLYEHSLSGLGRAYLMAIPFYRGIGMDQMGGFLGATVLGDLFYTLILWTLCWGLGSWEFKKSSENAVLRSN